MASPLVQVQEAGGSLDDFISRVRDAWYKAFPYSETRPRPWIADVFEDMVICSEMDSSDKRRYYRVAMTVTEDAVTFANRDEWQEVKLDYVDVVAGDVEEALSLTIREVIDDGDGLIDGVIVTEGQSFNGNVYTRAALESGVKVFQGALMFADHQSESERRDRPERSVRDIVGRVKEAYIGTTKDGKAALRGKFLISKAEEALKTKIREGIIDGLSLSALGKGKRDKSGVFVVESFQNHPFTSVDLVTVASAGGTFDRLSEAQRDTVTAAVLESLTPEQLKRARPDLAATPDAELTESDAPAEVRRLTESQGDEMAEELHEVVAQRDKLLEENARWFREARTEIANRIISEEVMENAQGLPDAALDRVKQVLESKVDVFATHGSTETEDEFKVAVEAVVEAERQYVAQLVANGHVSGLTAGDPLNESLDEAALDEALENEFKAMLG